MKVYGGVAAGHGAVSWLIRTDVQDYWDGASSMSGEVASHLDTSLIELVRGSDSMWQISLTIRGLVDEELREQYYD